ncbi:MAG: hypothetical protein KF763_20130 [Cyclobacteriaceae bacterium]|nr:hypothetical protein [Cyclobacteriaceae bacterium]
MGYMGFGLQKWIYTQKPRKGFDKLKKIYGDNLENSPGSGKGLPSNKYGAPAKSSVLERVRRENNSNRLRSIKVLIISIVVAAGLVAGLAWLIKTAYFK